jgi:hypothetical protein
MFHINFFSHVVGQWSYESLEPGIAMLFFFQFDLQTCDNISMLSCIYDNSAVQRLDAHLHDI